MKHPHHELIKQWADDTSRVVQAKGRTSEWYDTDGNNPAWFPHAEYRFKPEPKPDVVRCAPVHLNRATGEVSIKDVGGTAVCRFVFDCESGKLIKAEVI